MVRPSREQLAERVEADETLIGGARPGKPGRIAAGRTVVDGAIETAPDQSRKRQLGRLRLAAVPDTSAASLGTFLAGNAAPLAVVTTDGWRGYAGQGEAGYDHEAVHLVFGLARRWPPVSCADIRPGDRAKPDGTHHGAVSKKHLQADLDAHVFRFNRRTAKSICHRFARLIEQAAVTPAASYRMIVGQTGAV